MDQKICIVTGGSSGIGLNAAKALVNKGCKVYEFSRRDRNISELIHITCDVTNEAQVKEAVNSIYEKEGKIDLLLNSAGFGIAGAIEFTKLEDAKKQFDVNFFGVVCVSNAVLPIMRKQKHGRIVNISSMAAVTPIPFQAFYSATKSAIETYSMALANEVAQFGISVVSIEPGDIATGFTDARETEVEGDDIYNGIISKSISKMEHDERNGMKAEVAGAYVAKIALKKKVKPIYAIGFSYKAICILARILPNKAKNVLIGSLYAK